MKIEFNDRNFTNICINNFEQLSEFITENLDKRIVIISDEILPYNVDCIPFSENLDVTNYDIVISHFSTYRINFSPESKRIWVSFGPKKFFKQLT